MDTWKKHLHIICLLSFTWEMCFDLLLCSKYYVIWAKNISPSKLETVSTADFKKYFGQLQNSDDYPPGIPSLHCPNWVTFYLKYNFIYKPSSLSYWWKNIQKKTKKEIHLSKIFIFKKCIHNFEINLSQYPPIVSLSQNFIYFKCYQKLSFISEELCMVRYFSIIRKITCMV